MNKHNILLKISNPDDKLLVSKILDKIKFCQTRNKIISSNFLDIRQKNLIIKLLNGIKFSNFVCYGGFDNAERTCFIFYPEKFNSNFVMQNIDNFISCIRIVLPKELYNSYSHRNYLRWYYEIRN